MLYESEEILPKAVRRVGPRPESFELHQRIGALREPRDWTMIGTMSAPKNVYVAVVGTSTSALAIGNADLFSGVGGVGKAFMSQLQALIPRLANNFYASIRLSPILIARSQKMLFSEDFSPLSLENWESKLEASKTPTLPLTELLDVFAAAPHRVILVDNTSDQKLADMYPTVLSKGVSIVTPNKKAFSGSFDQWEDIFTAASSSGALVYHESTVGAGLPVISTLRDLVSSGDQVTKIEGVFSGTMSFLFNSFCPVGGGGGRFSAEVKKAKDLGYTVC